MRKRGKFLIKNLAVVNISLIVFSVFAFGFLIGESGRVSGADHGTGENKPTFSEWFLSLLGLGSGESTVSNPTQTNSRITATPPIGTTPELTGGSVVTGIKPGTMFNNIPGIKDPLDGGQISRVVPVGDKWALVDKDGKQIGELLDNEQYQQFQTAVAEQGGSIVGEYKGPFGVTGGFGHLFNGLLWAAGVAGAIQLFGNLLGLDPGLTNALSIGAAAGIMSYKILDSLGPTGFNKLAGDSFFVTNSGWIGLGVGIVVFVLLYKKESAKRVDFQCLPFEPPLGGTHCEECNKDEFRPCSEYRCKALGQACDLVNEGTEEEKCVWINPKDVVAPTITASQPLTEGHKYTNHQTRPPNRGTKIIRESSSDGCLAAFTPLTFSIVNNEPAQCKVDIIHRDTFDEMQFFIGNNNFFRLNHTQTMSLPSPSSINAEAPELENDGIYELFIRCRDKNGNENVDEYAVQFCVDPSPDTTPPVIVDTSILSGSPVAFDINEVPLQVYVNEPAECKWSRQNKNFDEMENAMSCATSLTQINARELYTCSTTLTGVQNNAENNYFFRCKDQPNNPENERYVNVNSYEFVLIGTQPLNILEAGPNEIITGSTTTVQVDLTVVTDDGADEGKAACYFSDTGTEGSYIQMFETNDFNHKQTLSLPSGSYEYFFRCVDAGGNAAESSIAFTVYIDNQAPLITRAYHDQTNNALRIVTNEDANCVYSLNSCNYNLAEGIELIYNNPSVRTRHFAEWSPNKVYYIKCQDDFGNEPPPNSCSLVASATNIA